MKRVSAHLKETCTLEGLTRLTDYSPCHFARLFRPATGESLPQAVLRQRVEQAQHLLRHTDLPIAQIAAESGFAHQSRLSRVVKRFIAMTPNAFRHSI
jgi:AraC family transcriptional regulator